MIHVDHRQSERLETGLSINPFDWWARLMARQTVARERHQLLELDEHQLRDIGITRYDAVREANRPSWDLPKRLKG